MSGGGSSPTQKPIRGCQMFDSGPVWSHFAVFVGGIVLWLVAYTSSILLFGSPKLVSAATADGLIVRQVSVGAAGVLVGLYFAVAYTKALGAPLPNLLAASAISVLMPPSVLTFGASPPDAVLIGESFFVSAVVLATGSGVTIIAVIGWYYLRFGGTGTEAAERWEDATFPPGFRLAVTGTEGGSIDWENTEYGLSEWSYWRFLRHGTVVFVGGMLLYGAVLGSQLFIREFVFLQLLEETPWLLLAVAGVGYTWWLNRRWRIDQYEVCQ